MSRRTSETPLITAIRSKNLELVAELLKKQPDNYDCRTFIKELRKIGEQDGK